MAILSVDLAFRRWTDLGIVVLECGREPGAPIACEIVPDRARERTRPCTGRGAGGTSEPSVWASGYSDRDAGRSAGMEIDRQRIGTCAAERTGAEHSRQDRIAGHGEAGHLSAFAEFCVDVYDAFCRRGWKRLAASDQPRDSGEHILAESYPYAAWKALGIRPLPAKKRATVCDLAEAFAALQATVPVTVNRPPNHDQLQAIVGGLAGLALEARNPAGARIVGSTPRREDGHWREGFIVVPQSTRTWPTVRWMN